MVALQAVPSVFNSSAASRQDEWVSCDSGLIKIRNVLAVGQDLLNALGPRFQTYATLTLQTIICKVYPLVYTALLLFFMPHYQKVNRIFWSIGLRRIPLICFPEILHGGVIRPQMSHITAGNRGMEGQRWTKKRGALSGFIGRHKIKHLNIMKLWRGLKFTPQLQNKCFQFGTSQASPKRDVVQGKVGILYFTGTKGDTKKALVVKPAAFPLSSPAMENVFKMGSTKSHFTYH